jgi:hypothetical protein
MSPVALSCGLDTGRGVMEAVVVEFDEAEIDVVAGGSHVG